MLCLLSPFVLPSNSVQCTVLLRNAQRLWFAEKVNKRQKNDFFVKSERFSRNKEEAPPRSFFTTSASTIISASSFTVATPSHKFSGMETSEDADAGVPMSSLNSSNGAFPFHDTNTSQKKMLSPSQTSNQNEMCGQMISPRQARKRSVIQPKTSRTTQKKKNSQRDFWVAGHPGHLTLCVCFCVPPSLNTNENPIEVNLC